MDPRGMSWVPWLTCAVWMSSCLFVDAKSCEPHFGWMQAERHNRRLEVVLDPVHDSALLLHRENPRNREAAVFAHRLLRVPHSPPKRRKFNQYQLVPV